MHSNIFSALAIVLILTCTALAAAAQPIPLPNLFQFQGTPEEQAACRPDVVKFCKDAIPDSFRVLACLQERPMHPYEMATTMRQRGKHESIKLNYGSLYTVIELMTSRGLIRSKETSRGGKRPERTVYALTPAGRDLLRNWMRHLLAEPAKEFSQFEAALCLLPVLPPDEAVALLRDRRSRLEEKLMQMRAELQDILGQIQHRAAVAIQAAYTMLARFRELDRQPNAAMAMPPTTGTIR